MNVKKWLLSSLVVWIVYAILEWIIHGGILSGMYQQHTELWLPEAQMQSRMWAMLLGQLLLALLFCYIYTKGIREGGVAEGLRYGFWLGLLLSVPFFFIRWSVELSPGMLIFLQSLFELITILILGIVLGAVYGKVEKA